jgi:hypothetical protein
MKHSFILFLLLSFLAFTVSVNAQKGQLRAKSKPKTAEKKGTSAIIVDRRLSVLRNAPSLYALPIQRLGVGREVIVLGEKTGDGVLFYQVRTANNMAGWVQAEAVIGSFRKNDDQRLAKLVQASDDFDKIDKAVIFLEQFPTSLLRPSILLLIGDLMEEEALDLSKAAAKSLDRSEMAASGAPLHSFYLNFPSLDRYRKIGIRFLFNVNTKTFHYDGEAWLEILRKFPNSSEAEEAKKRLDTLKEKMEKK